MKIGILGSGNMGRCLGMVWAERGHDLFFGDQDREKAQRVAEFVNQGTASRETVNRRASGGTVEAAAAHGQVLLHTARDVMLSAMLPSIHSIHGKVIIDCNNESTRPPSAARERSHAERLAADAPQVHIVKAFNTISQEIFEYCPDDLVNFKVSCFVCGDDEQAVKLVMELAQGIGFMAVNCGALRNARLLEGFGDFIRVMIKQQETSPLYALSYQQLPQISAPRLGGRSPRQFEPSG